ncbi:MAG: PQQ-dependent sugar dehydrogenase [Trueperaceae bacterium]|nr:PQQ-dependent sugar dehydrogenase [Trueperaceae bacterium]
MQISPLNGRQLKSASAVHCEPRHRGASLATRSLQLALVSLLLAASAAFAQEPELPPGFVYEVVYQGLSNPVDVAFAPNGHVFFAQKDGSVRVAVGGELLARPFIDMTDTVNSLGDRGLVGVTVNPRFPAVPHVYIAYVYEPPESVNVPGPRIDVLQGTRASRLIRVTADPATGYSTAIPGSEVMLLGRNSDVQFMGDMGVRNPPEPSCGNIGQYVQDCLPADEHSHTIGRVRFGPDGALYVGSGDGADYHSTQPYHIRTLHLDSLAGKVLRIDPFTGQGLPDNPFYDGNPDSNRSKVLNYGLRNPYSFTFHPETGELVMGEVGWANWEMIKVGSGFNFGWPCYEGANGELLQQASFQRYDECQALYEGEFGEIKAPSFAYDRQGTGGAIIVGDFYTGDTWPDRYHGVLLVADYYQGWIRTVDLDLDGPSPELEPFASVPFPVYVGFGPDRELYFLNVWGGQMVRLRYAGEAPGSLPATR